MYYVQRNREIAKRSNTILESIQLSIRKIINEYNVSIQYHDAMGLFMTNFEISSVLMEYYSHTNDFCANVKCDKQCALECFMLKDKITKKLVEVNRPIYGRCNMGFEEYIFPVYSTDTIIGYFAVGEFYTDRKETEKYIKNISKKHSFDEKKVINDFFKIARKVDFDVEAFITDMNLLANTVGLYIKNVISDIDIEKKKIAEQGMSSKNYVVEMAKEYIAANFARDVSLETISQVCHCNSSYLSCIFKKKTGKSVSEYVNVVRINRAKLLLWVSPMSVTQISYEVGYNDSGYFSRVFKKHLGVSPDVFRKRMNRKKQIIE